MRVISLREEPVYTQAAIDFFQSRWATDSNKMIYEDCIVPVSYTHLDVYKRQPQGKMLF